MYILIWLTKEGCLLETWCNDIVTLPYPLITKCIASFMFGSFPKCVWLCTHNKKTEEEEEVASFLHGMRAIIISTWQLQNVYRHRGGPHSSSCQSSGGREGRGQNIFSHMRAPIFTFMCAAMWVDLFYCKLRVVLINAWLFVLNVWKENWEKATWGSCHLLPAPCFLSLSQSIGLEYDLDLLIFFFTDFSKLIFRAILCFIKAFFFLA